MATPLRLLASGLVVLLAFAQAPSAAGKGAAPATSGCAQPTLEAPAHSSHAVTALGDDIARVAAPPGWSRSRVKRELLADPALWVDRCGALFFVDSAPTAVRLPAPGTSAAATAQAVAPADAFTLHSRPGSNRAIFLDFDGQTVQNTAWNAQILGAASWSAPAWDVDGNATSFSDAERRTIIEVWQRVADDYAPFDIDVTTADPGLAALERSSDADQVFGTRALISPDVAAANALCGGTCGGIAYLNTFDLPGNAAYQPAWVFPQRLSNSAKYIADAASHEVGHNLSLSHDGLSAAAPSGAQGYYRGSAGWGPIMGAPYGQVVTQWSRGEYQFASNTEDDVSLISSAGAPLLSDDVGDTALSATAITPGTPRDATITSAADVDWYSFTASGPVTATVTPLATWPNLDTRLVLTSAEGTELASSAPAFTTSGWPANAAATITDFQLPAAGSYRLVVAGVGNGIPNSDGATDYGSLGEYRLTVNTSLVVTGPAQTQALALNVPASLQLEAASGTAPYSWSLISGSLPPGLTLSGSTISGTPTTVGTWQLSVRATDATAVTASRDLTLTVVPPVSVSAPANPVALTAGGRATVTLNASGGQAPYAWALTSGSLPPGLTLTGGTISGIPLTAGTWTAALRATDTLAQTADSTVTFTVADHLTVSALASTVRLIAGTPASINLAASGGTPPLTWHVTSDSLPTGLRFSGSAISGTPTQPASWPARVSVTDAAGAAAYQDVTFEVVPQLRIIEPSSPLLLVQGGSTAFALSALGGFGAYEWSVVGGSLPPGISLSGALITGVPTHAGAWTAAIQVRDETSAVAMGSFAFQVAAGALAPSPPASTGGLPLSLASTTSLPQARKKHPYLARLTATGGSGQLAWRRTAGKLPRGMKLRSTGILSGNPTRKGRFKFTLQVRDATGRTATSRYTLRVR